MIPRSVRILAIPVLMTLASADESHASTVATPSRFTIVQGNVDAVMLSEFDIVYACGGLQIDSIVRRSPGADPADHTPSSSATVFWSAFQPKIDSATAATCINIRHERSIDPIPRIESYQTLPGGGSFSIPVAFPVDPDSIFECHDGLCSHQDAGIVRNSLDPSRCLDGMAAPAPSADSALSWLRGRLAQASGIYLLQRVFQPRLDISVACNPDIINQTSVGASGAARSLTSGTLEETRLRFVGDTWTEAGSLAPVGDRWSDPAISVDLALPSGSNAGDYFSPETLLFRVEDLRASPMVGPMVGFSYPSGIKTYQYRGWDSLRVCPNTTWSLRPSLIGDSLRLRGPSVRLSNDGCARPGVDVFADKYSRWLFAPSEDGLWVDAFRHGTSLGYGSSWPVVDDSVMVAGWRVPLSEVRSVAGLRKESPRAAFRAMVRSGRLEVDLPSASRVEVLAPSGRTIASGDQPAGGSVLALGGVHGLILVRANSQVVRILAP